MAIPSKRSEYVALTSLVLSIVFFITALLVSRWSGFFAVYSVSWLLLSAALIWFVLVIQFHQRSLAEQERLDSVRQAGPERSSTIFREKGERPDLFAVARQRLSLIEKWFLPIFAALIAAYQIAIGLYLLNAVSAAADVETIRPLICAICMMAIAFVCFLISRYATGMSAQLHWKPLRAGGSIFLGIAVVCFASAIGLALAHFKFFVVLRVIDFAVGILLIILGAETALNVVMDMYRPRLKGQYSRSAFDSRLLGIINEPGHIVHTAAGAIDYQFGFKVSQTWFYKLLAKAIVPLVIFAAAILYLLSCIVVVAPNEEAIIEHFGNPLNGAGQVRLVGSGLTFKWPWPIDIAYKYPTKKISEISIGFVPKIDPDAKRAGYGPLLWGKAHHEKEYSVLVASQHTGEKMAEGAVPVSLVKANVPVHYRVKDLYSFIYNHSRPEELLESICYRQLTKFVASAKIEVETEADFSESLLGAGRARAKEMLTRSIQTAADEAGLGIEIVFLGLQGIHPPPEVTADYQKVIGAVQKKQALILEAEAESNKTLSSLAGSVEDANELYLLAAKYQQAREQNDIQQLENLGEELDRAFARARGDIFSTLRQSQSYAFEKTILAKATGRRFADQLKAYRAGKEIYRRQQRLAVFEEALDKVRKYVVVADTNDMQVFVIDVQEKLTPSLYDIGDFEEK